MAAWRNHVEAIKQREKVQKNRKKYKNKQKEKCNEKKTVLYRKSSFTHSEISKSELVFFFLLIYFFQHVKTRPK